MLFATLFFIAGKSFPNVAFYHYGIENGLPESKIVSISQDSTGFIWLAGENGLYRFDGNQFNVYQTTMLNSSPVPFIRINTLFTDSRGKLWVGSNDGLSYFNSATNQFIKLGEDFIQQRVLDIFEDNKGKLWLATEFGLAEFDRETENTKWFTAPNSTKNTVFNNLPSNYILHAAGQPDGKIWLVTHPAGLWFFDPETGEIENYSQVDGTDFSQFNISEIHYHSGTLFLGTLDNGFFRIEPQKKSVRNETLNLLAYAIQHFRQLNDSIFWLATNNGLFHYNILNGTFTRYTNEPNNPLSLNRTTVNFVYLDKEKNLWLSLGIRGINYGLTNVPFSHLTPGAEGPYQLLHKEVTSIHFDSDGNMWLGYEAGLIEKHMYDPLVKKQYQIKSKKPEKTPGSVMTIFEDSKKRMWAGGWMSGLNVLLPKNNEFKPAEIEPESVSRLVESADVRGITEDNYGNIWISFHGIGLGKYNPETQILKIFRNIPEKSPYTLSNDYTYNLCFDDEGNLWIATAHGVSKLSPATEKFTAFFHDESNPKSLNSNTISVIFCDNSGTVWAGTEKGLNVYSPQLNNFIPVFTDKDFSFLNISSLQSGKPGELWLSTNDGIFRLNYSWNADKTEMDAEPTWFNRSDGLLSSNYFPRSAATSSDGLIFFCGNEGIDFFNPEEVSDFSEPQTKVLITEFWIDGEPYFPDTNTAKSSPDKLELSHRHKILSIRFTALDFSNTGIKKFRYKLEGIHNDWVYLQNEQMASFTHLPPGNYTFSVETQQKNNEWTGNDSTLEISVKRPFWLSVPFYIFVFLMLAAAVYFLTKARSKVLIMRQKELEKIIRERTLELTQKNRELEIANQTKDKFFSIISHDLRSPLSGLLGILDLLTDDENTLSQEEQKGLLQSAKSSAYNTYELLENLLLWARSQMRTTTISAKKQNLSEVLKKNITLKRATANQKKITLTGNFPDNLEAQFDREMINTVIRNILSNAIKFTPPGGDINLYATAENGEVTVSIADTGIGTDTKNSDKLFELGNTLRLGTNGEKGTGLGLVICKEFVKNNRGKIWAEPNKPKGTIFHFTLPATNH